MYTRRGLDFPTLIKLISVRSVRSVCFTLRSEPLWLQRKYDFLILYNEYRSDAYDYMLCCANSGEKLSVL